MEKIESYFNDKELAQIKEITGQINDLTAKLEGQSESAVKEINKAITQNKEVLEELRVGVFKREYSKLNEEEQYAWWVNEFENQIKSRTGGEYLYKMFSLEQYEYWSKLDEDFDDLFLQLCMDFDLEYEFAFSLCEHEQGSEMWNHLIDINQD